MPTCSQLVTVATLALAVSWSFALQSAGAAVPSHVEANFDSVVEFLYRSTPPRPSPGGTLPACDQACDDLWTAGQALDPGRESAQDVWRQMYALNKRAGIFVGFDRLKWEGYFLQAPPEKYWAVELGENTHLWVGVRRPVSSSGNPYAPFVDIEDPLVSVGGGQGEQARLPTPTFGWNGGRWMTNFGAKCSSSEGPVPSPGPSFYDYYDLGSGGLSFCYYWKNPGDSAPTASWTVRMHSWFSPIHFDGPPTAGTPYPPAGKYQLGNLSWVGFDESNPTDPGFVVTRTAMLSLLGTHPRDYQDLLDWLEKVLSEADAPPPNQSARYFEPRLMFDKGEKWRPLNVDRFLAERYGGAGPPLQCVGTSRSACTPLLDGAATLREHHSDDDHIFQGGAVEPGSEDELEADDYRSPDPACITQPDGGVHPLQDCDSGPASAIYYKALERSAGYNYYDYWFFYRYNEFVADEHEADWEHVTVAPSLSDPTTFDWVAFFQHTYHSNYSNSPGTSSYLRELMTCDDGGDASCGSDIEGDPTGHRVWVFVAGGSHASYAVSCSNLCTQPGLGFLEGDHGGQMPWGMNEDSQGLLPFPQPVGWTNPTQGAWTDWPGRWGAQGAPSSPDYHRPEFNCPWINNPSDATPQTACASRQRAASTAAAAVSRAATACASWFGIDVIAAACSPSELGSAVRRGVVGRHGTFSLSVVRRHDRTASGRGIAQVAGSPLRPGDRVVLHGRFPLDGQILLRARLKGKPREWRLTHLRPRRGQLSILIPRLTRGRPQITG